LRHRFPFTPEEDWLLAVLVRSNYGWTWVEVAARIPGRTARQCRDRWTNYLAPGVSFAPWTPEEDARIIELVNDYGTKWATIAHFMTGRNDNSIKIRWYSELRLVCRLREDGKWEMNPNRERACKPKKIGQTAEKVDDFWERNLEAIDRQARMHSNSNPMPDIAARGTGDNKRLTGCICE
jgi:hypothetical protein